jgi:hypothetical protein
MVLGDLKEDFLVVLFAHLHSSTCGNGGFGIRARVGCITPIISKNDSEFAQTWPRGSRGIPMAFASNVSQIAVSAATNRVVLFF